jgi:RecA/RadA recombinase
MTARFEHRAVRDAPWRVWGFDSVLRAVSDVAAGTGAAIRISGGPGSGKTGLLHQAAETARLQALAVGLSAPA